LAVVEVGVAAEICST